MNIEEAKKLVNKLNWSYFDMSEEASDEYVEAVHTVLSELEEKDKIIDLMAEFINKFDLDESICKDIKCNNDVTKQDCINCIKKYFFDKKSCLGKEI